MTSANTPEGSSAPAAEEAPSAAPAVEEHIDPMPTEGRSEPSSEARSETSADRGRPFGQWLAGAGSGLGIVGTALYETTGVVGLAATAVVAAGAGYGAYRMRTGGSSRATRTRTSSSRTVGGRGMPKLGRGGGLKLGGGKASKLFTGKSAGLGGRRGGSKLGRGGMPKLGRGGGPKLGRGGGPKLGSGKASKLFTGKSARQGGGGLLGRGTRGGRSTTARTGSVGVGRAGRVGRGGRGGFGLGRRGGRVLGGLGGKGRGALGRWSNSTGGGAGLVAGMAGRAAKRAGRKALNTRAGRRATDAVRAAKTASAQTSGRWAKLRRAQAAARKTFGSHRNPFARWSATVGAGVLALWAMLHDRWQARHHPPEDAKTATDAPPTEVPPRTEKTTSPGTPDAPKPTPDRAVLSGRLIPPRRLSMSQFPLVNAASEIPNVAGRYWPETMWHVDQDLEQVDQLPLAVAQGLQIMTKNLQSAYPIHPAIVEAMGRMYIALGEVAASCAEIPKLFKQLHADDIRRKTAPRPGEHKWNV